MSGLSALPDAMLESINLLEMEVLFENDLDIEQADRHILNQYVIYRFSQYSALNAKKFDL
jgi:hypothetical protein